MPLYKAIVKFLDRIERLAIKLDTIANNKKEQIGSAESHIGYRPTIY